MPVLVSVFNTRLKICSNATFPTTLPRRSRKRSTDLRAMMARVPRDSFPVEEGLAARSSQAWEDDFWTLITPAKIDFLRLKVAPLLRFAADVDVAAETFTHKVERLKLQILQATPVAAVAAIDRGGREPAPRHSRARPILAQRRSSLSPPTSPTATPAQLTQIIRDLAPQMKNRRDRPSAFLKIDLPDFIATHGYISVGEGGQQIYVEEYKRRVETRVLEIVEKHPALAAHPRGPRGHRRSTCRPGAHAPPRTRPRRHPTLQPTTSAIAYGLRVDNFLAFLRHLLALDTIPDYPQVVQRGFEQHIQPHNYNAEQIRFLRSVQEVFLQKRTLVEADLYDPPLTNFGRNAVERFFTPAGNRSTCST